jgi:hypothetical protein
MSRKADGVPAIQSGHYDVGRNVGNGSPSGLERSRPGILRRRREVPARVSSVRACPACGLPIRDAIAARLGFCDRCRDFTGMCGAGRRIICPDLMTRTTWHTPCTELGAVAWEINHGQGTSRTVLCRVHDAQIRFGGMPWIVDAVPLDQARSRPPRQSASGRTG